METIRAGQESCDLRLWRVRDVPAIAGGAKKSAKGPNRWNIGRRTRRCARGPWKSGKRPVFRPRLHRLGKV